MLSDRNIPNRRSLPAASGCLFSRRFSYSCSKSVSPDATLLLFSFYLLLTATYYAFTHSAVFPHIPGHSKQLHPNFASILGHEAKHDIVQRRILCIHITSPGILPTIPPSDLHMHLHNPQFGKMIFWWPISCSEHPSRVPEQFVLLSVLFLLVYVPPLTLISCYVFIVRIQLLTFHKTYPWTAPILA